MIASWLESALMISGGSASSGSAPMTREIVRRGVDVAAHVELDPHLRALVLAVGLDLENALDAGDRVFDRLRDFRLYDCG
jgi:hypothetical protein